MAGSGPKRTAAQVARSSGRGRPLDLAAGTTLALLSNDYDEIDSRGY